MTYFITFCLSNFSFEAVQVYIKIQDVRKMQAQSTQAAYVSQSEYVHYTDCLCELKVLQQCYEKNRLNRIGILDGHFVKLQQPSTTITAAENQPRFKQILSTINQMHERLKSVDFTNATVGDCASLAADQYNKFASVIHKWNECNKNYNQSLVSTFNSPLTPSFSHTDFEQVADDKAWHHYIKLMAKYPILKREGELNDYTKGAYQIIYDLQIVKEVREAAFKKIYDQAIKEGMNAVEARAFAMDASRIGVICADQYMVLIRDAVISPVPPHVKHTYIRFIWKSGLDEKAGAAVLPVLDTTEGKKIVVELIYRHSPGGGSWELEIPRGSSKPSEDALATATRELREETGYSTGKLIYLGTMPPDTGILASEIPVYMGVVSDQQEKNLDKTESIKKTYAFSLKEIKAALVKGAMDLNGEYVKIHCRDPFLTYAILIAEQQKLL